MITALILFNSLCATLMMALFGSLCACLHSLTSCICAAVILIIFCQAGKNRISAGILKLAGKDINALDELIEKANKDSRDIMMWAEYPGRAKIGFDELAINPMKQIYIDDFIEYSNWMKT